MNPRRRTAAVLTLLLGAGALPGLVPAPAGAAPGCLRDVSGFDGCDDTTPPETAIGATAPRINAAGWMNKTTIRVGLSGGHTDTDTDPVALECSLGLDPEPPTEAEWADCPGGGVFSGLTDTASKPYVLWARAVDTTDAALTWDDWATPLQIGDETGTDHDASPARLEFKVDTVVPSSYIFDTPYDPITPQLPMVTDPDVTLTLAASEAAGFACTLDATAVPCAGSTRLRSVKPGDHTFGVQAVDQAGNVDPSPATTRFAVPTNLTAKRTPKSRPAAWKKVARSGYLGGDYLLATERGAKLRLRTGKYGEVRLLATTAPDAGVVEIRLGGAWQRVSLKRRTTTKHDQIQVLDEFAPRRAGTIRIRVVSQGKPVRLDGLLVH